jgi:membrane glycosyltransferase
VGKKQGFIRAVVDPCVHVLHLSFLRKDRRYSKEIIDWHRELGDKALIMRPDFLDRKEKKTLLLDPAVLKQLHRAVWSITDQALAKKWRLVP